ncbi:MAG: DsbA family protein [Burkholderiaceae bacterium]
MPATVLHYIHDPLCGWCYGAAPLISAAREVLPVSAHAGGMMIGASRQPVSETLRNYVMPHDKRIAALTGQPFGDAYFNGLLHDRGAVFDSEPPISAVLAAEALSGRGLDLLARIQIAHYVEGRRIADMAVLTDLAMELGIDSAAFAAGYAAVFGEETTRHITDSRRLLSRVGGHGFPTLALERDGNLEALDIGPWLGRPDAFRTHLMQYAT